MTIKVTEEPCVGCIGPGRCRVHEPKDGDMAMKQSASLSPTVVVTKDNELEAAVRRWKQARDRYYSDPSVTCQEYGVASELLAAMISPPRCTRCGHERWVDDQGLCGEIESDGANEGDVSRCGCKCVFPISQPTASASAQTTTAPDHDVVGSGLTESESSISSKLAEIKNAWTINDRMTHWEGCYLAHYTCAINKLGSIIDSLQAEKESLRAELQALAERLNTPISELRDVAAVDIENKSLRSAASNMKDELVKRVREFLERNADCFKTRLVADGLTDSLVDELEAVEINNTD